MGLTLRNLLTRGTQLGFVHGDTTSKLMYGDYEDNGTPDKLNNFGYTGMDNDN